MQRKLLVANWKANPATLAEAQALFEAENQQGVVICPPAVYLSSLRANGAQDIFWESGAHTGQISPAMLKQFGVTYVLVGHSERRAVGETDEQINKKLKAVLAAGMTPVLLIGEQEKNDAIRQDILIDQLTRDLEGISTGDAQKILFTYEPVWAISTHADGQAATPDDALSAIREMQGILEKNWRLEIGDWRFLYGGSVNEHNILDFLKHSDIQGAVVGGASLRAEEFTKMIEIAAKL